jgi:hypothetical protein
MEENKVKFQWANIYMKWTIVYLPASDCATRLEGKSDSSIGKTDGRFLDDVSSIRVSWTNEIIVNLLNFSLIKISN